MADRPAVDPGPVDPAPVDPGPGDPAPDGAAVDPSALPVDARIFGFLTLFFVVATAIYAIADDDATGVVLLGLSGAFSALLTLYLLARGRGRTVDTRPDVAHDARHRPYFPESSLWPLGVGAGLTLTLAGLALGAWVWLPGVVLLIRSGIGWAAQSRAGW